jgi:hypothetical protein
MSVRGLTTARRRRKYRESTRSVSKPTIRMTIVRRIRLRSSSRKRVVA